MAERRFADWLAAQLHRADEVGEMARVAALRDYFIPLERPDMRRALARALTEFDGASEEVRS